MKRMKRHNGRVDCYWVADEKLVHQGYAPKTVRLFGNPEDPAEFEQMASKCRLMQAEMLQWASGITPTGNRSPRGTIAWLCDAFETDRDSPFHELRLDTQLFYSGKIAIIKGNVGGRRLDTIIGKDFRRWFKQWGRFNEATQTFGAHRRGYACIQTLRRVIAYGAELGDGVSLKLSSVLSKMRFQSPKRRTVRPTFEQIDAAVEQARKDGYPSIALAIRFQFDAALRQRDVIGEWVGNAGGTEQGILDGAKRWHIGLTWAHISSDMVLRKPTSKSNGTMVAEHDLKASPELLALITEIPRERRVGPIIVDEGSGKPWRRNHFARTFRKIATAAGWPKDLWNMDARAGAISEAFESEAAAEDVMKSATHTQMSTTMGYNRGGVVQSSRVAKLRQERRNKARNQDGNSSGNKD
jgi:hypothetical protein